MKRFLAMLFAVFFTAITAFALPTGKYSDGGDSTVFVSKSYIQLYIGQYKAGTFTIISVNHDDQTFVVSSDGNDRISCRWYYQDGELYIKMGKRTLKYCD